MFLFDIELATAKIVYDYKYGRRANFWHSLLGISFRLIFVQES